MLSLRVQAAFPLLQAVIVTSLAAVPPNPHGYPSQLPQGTRWGSPEYSPSLHFSPGTWISIGTSLAGLWTPQGSPLGIWWQSFSSVQPRADPWGVGGSWSCPLMNTTLLAPHSICHYSPYVCKLPLSCQLAALQVSFFFFKNTMWVYWLFLLRLSQKNDMDVSQDFQELFTALILF